MTLLLRFWHEICFINHANKLHRVGKMMNSNIRQTVFSIEKLKNAVNVGSCSAYQIYTSPGEQLGEIGAIINPETLFPANDENIPEEIKSDTTVSASSSWLARAFAALKS